MAGRFGGSGGGQDGGRPLGVPACYQAGGPPSARAEEWVRNPIDGFILARLENEGIEPSEPARPATLARRVSLDLTGLPPPRADLEAFLAAPGPAGYERLVDRLLESPHYGERWAIHCLTWHATRIPTDTKRTAKGPTPGAGGSG